MNTNVKEILVIGLGLIGSSIAKVSKEKGIKVYGFDIDENSIKYALENNIIDESFASIEEINNENLTSYIDLIVIAVSPEATKHIINRVERLWNSDITITDTASVKAHLLFKNTSNLVLSHPIADQTNQGYWVLMKIYLMERRLLYAIHLMLKNYTFKD
jgi:prephenate dehydrogenase